MDAPKVKPKKKRRALAQKDNITALRKLLVYYKEITETIREPFIILNRDLYVVTANLAFYHKFKVRKKDTEDQLIYELGDNQWDARELRKLLEHILPKHRVFSNYEVTHNFPGLGRRTMSLNARQVDSKQLILLAIEDVTEVKALKHDSDEVTENLIRQRDQLQILNDAKDEFISLASHQLRTPATAVKQYVSMLTQGYAGKVSKAQRDMLNVVYESNERQLEIIEDLLRVARVDAGKVYLHKSRCDVSRQIEGVVRDQAVLFNSRGQKVIYHKPKKKIIAYIDEKLMRMVLENLIDNAGKYSKWGGKITIGVSQNKQNTIVSISDTGVGIRAHDIKRLFKKFSRIDNAMSNSVRGTGLGLYWAKQILDLHEGSIEVTSKLNKGSTFKVTIPLETSGVLKVIPIYK